MSKKLRLSDSKKQLFFSELYTLLSAGLDFSTSFSLLISSEQDHKLKELMSTLYQRIVSGSALWKSMQSCGCFSALDFGVIQIGEQTGRINGALDFLSDHYRKRIDQQRMVISAVSYPLVIFFTAIVVVIFMVLVVVPMFEQVYSRMGNELPILTQFIILISKKFPTYIISIFFMLAMVILFFMLWGERPEVRSAVASILMRLPIIGSIIRKNEQVRFCRLLYLLLVSGIPLLYGLEMLQNIITFYPYQVSLGDFCKSLKQGELLYKNMERYPSLYGSKFTALVRVGEETHRLPQMLKRYGDELASELEYGLKRLGTVLEPILILFVGALVAIILISMYLPMFKLGGIME